MAKTLPLDFDWQNSRPHLGLLRIYKRPKAPARQEYAEHGLRETSLAAIDRLLQAGALVECDVHEKIDAKFKVSDLKELLKQKGLKSSGDRGELVARLMAADQTLLPRLVTDFRLIKCSQRGSDAVERFDRLQENLKMAAISESHASLLKGDAKSAYAVYLRFQRESREGAIESNSYTVERISSILDAIPPSYQHLSSEKQRLIQAAAAMKELWYDLDVAELVGLDCLPDGEIDRAIRFFKENAEFRLDRERQKEWADEVVISFDNNDVDLCDACLAFDKKRLKLADVPDFPTKNCSNPSGCIPRLETTEDHAITINLGDNILEEDDAEEPVEVLRKLKQMLEEGLIERSEYDAKKAEILSRM